MAYIFTTGDSSWMLGNISPKEWCCGGAAARGGVGVTVPGGVQETFRCCTEGCGLVGNIGGRWTVGLDDLRGLFQPW